jgi:hypothetical protein
MNVLRIAAAIVLAATAAAGAQTPCSRETVQVRGTVLSVSFCTVGAPVTASAVTTVAVDATYATKDHSLVQRTTLRFITGEGPARALENVNLGSLGIEGTLHMTLLYSGNQISMEHALLTPGAVTVK